MKTATKSRTGFKVRRTVARRVEYTPTYIGLRLTRNNPSTLNFVLSLGLPNGYEDGDQEQNRIQGAEDFGKKGGMHAHVHLVAADTEQSTGLSLPKRLTSGTRSVKSTKSIAAG